MRLRRVLWGSVGGFVLLGTFVALHLTPAQEALPIPVPGTVPEGRPSVPPEAGGGRAEPEGVELVPVSLDLGRWDKDERGRRVWVGEELEYQIRWQGVPAGRALLRVKARHHFPDEQGSEVWLARMDLRSNRFLSLFFPVDGKTQSRIDTKGGFSRQYSKDHDEGPYSSKERVVLDYALDKLEALYEYPAWHRLAVEDRFVQKAPWRKVSIALNGKVLDPLSVVYYLRGLDLVPGQGVVVPVLADRRVWNTRIEVEARETILRPSGEGPIECLRLRPECHYNGLFARRGPVTLWVDARTKVVIRMTAETPLGGCEAWLDRHVGSPLD